MKDQGMRDEKKRMEVKRRRTQTQDIKTVQEMKEGEKNYTMRRGKQKESRRKQET